MFEPTLISDVEAVIGNLALQVGIILILAAIIALLLYHIKRGKKKRRKTVKKISKGEDEKKVAMASKMEELQSENVELRERLKSLELKQVEDIGDLGKQKSDLEQKTAELDDGLAEILAIKEALNHHRMRVGQMEKEKTDLLNEISDLKARHHEEKESLKKEFDAEKERLKKDIETEKKKFEEGEGEIKARAKGTIMRHERERAALIAKLQSENAKLKQAVQKMKEKLGIWERIEDI